eukprot:766738-Hanusia_phi.AAC.4
MAWAESCLLTFLFSSLVCLRTHGCTLSTSFLDIVSSTRSHAPAFVPAALPPLRRADCCLRARLLQREVRATRGGEGSRRGRKDEREERGSGGKQERKEEGEERGREREQTLDRGGRGECEALAESIPSLGLQSCENIERVLGRGGRARRRGRRRGGDEERGEKRSGEGGKGGRIQDGEGGSGGGFRP